MMMKPALIAFLAAAAFGACAGGDAGVSKDDVRESGGKSDDGVDYCLEFDWYCDGECDTFCTQPDPDCDVPNWCASALCGPGTTCDESQDMCVDNGFCTTALCGPGTRCDESQDACVTDDPSFCASALCGPGTTCDESQDACVSVPLTCTL